MSAHCCVTKVPVISQGSVCDRRANWRRSIAHYRRDDYSGGKLYRVRGGQALVIERISRRRNSNCE